MAVAEEPRCLTVDDAGKMNTFELRQEVERRGILGEITDKGIAINYNSLLRTLVRSIVEEERASGECLAVSPAEQKKLKESLEQRRRERKEAALARSKARQAETSYFSRKKSSAAAVSDAPGPSYEAPLELQEESDEEPLISAINPKGFKIFSR